MIHHQPSQPCGHHQALGGPQTSTVPSPARFLLIPTGALDRPRPWLIICHFWDCRWVLPPGPSFAHRAEAPWHRVSRWCGHCLCWWHLQVPSCPPARNRSARAAPGRCRSTASDKCISKEETALFNVFLTILRPPSLIQTHLSINCTVPKTNLQSFLQSLHRENSSDQMWCWY